MFTLTEKAISEIKRIQSSNPESEGTMLRVMVTGGGCSGLSYKLGFDRQPAADTDKVFEHGEVKVVVDPKSYLFINGVTLDFSDGLNGKGFVFNNPNAKKTCGCGNSFST